MNYPQPAQTYVVLLHYPVYNRNGEIITSAITNLDIHDIARVCQTYGLAGYYIVTPGKNQFRLLQETITFWQDGVGQEYNPTRSHSFGIVHAAQSLTAVKKTLGKSTLFVVTTAKRRPNCIDLTTLREFSQAQPERKIALIFGTGFGLTDAFIESIEYVLNPIEGGTERNHLSVRSAVSIIIDRLFGR